MMTTAAIYVGLGSNLGDRASYLLRAVRGMLEAHLSIERLSSIYETAAIDVLDQPPFLNMVAELGSDSEFDADQVMARLLSVEHSLGRTREVPKGPRTIDLDLLFYGDEIRRTELLTLPHPRLHLRRFVLAPLAELAPTLVHPVVHKTIAELLDTVQDDAAVQRWPPGNP